MLPRKTTTGRCGSHEQKEVESSFFAAHVLESWQEKRFLAREQVAGHRRAEAASDSQPVQGICVPDILLAATACFRDPSAPDSERSLAARVLLRRQ